MFIVNRVATNSHWSRLCISLPVSYTHLDVYKRQPLRPTVSFINSPTYKISKEISKRIKMAYEKEEIHCIENSKKVIED